MALFRNLCVNLRDSLCGVRQYASAQSLDFLDLTKNCSFMNWKLQLASSQRFWMEANVSSLRTHIRISHHYLTLQPSMQTLCRPCSLDWIARPSNPGLAELCCFVE